MRNIMAKQKLIIMRGVPGSGKSTMAQKLAQIHNAIIRSTDDEFIDENGNYVFDPNRLEWNHLKNQTKAEADLLFGHNVVIDNTNTTFKEMEPYLRSAKKVKAEVLI